MTKEKQFENCVKKWLNSQGVYAAGTPSQKMQADQHGWYFKVWGGGLQKAGIPDILMCINGFFVSVELKSKTGTPTDLQKLNTERINTSGGIGIILYPDDFEEFKQLISTLLSFDEWINFETVCPKLMKGR